MAGECPRDTPDHCCYLDGVACPFLSTDEDGLWACGLRAELGSWTLVHSDLRYLAVVRPIWDKVGMEDCGDYPALGRTCGECKLTGV